jgi:hypothetical protein
MKRTLLALGLAMALNHAAWGADNATTTASPATLAETSPKRAESTFSGNLF